MRLEDASPRRAGVWGIRRPQRDDTSALPIIRHQDGSITVLGGGTPAAPAERRLAVAQTAGLTILAASSLGLANWLPLGAGVSSLLDLGAVLALGAAAVLTTRRRSQRQRVEIDWRREEIRWHTRRRLTTVGFAAVRSVAVEGRWPPDSRASMVYDVLIEAPPDRLLAGVFDREDRASVWADELRELMGLSTA
jgi:hypothetical protein